MGLMRTCLFWCLLLGAACAVFEDGEPDEVVDPAPPDQTGTWSPVDTVYESSRRIDAGGQLVDARTTGDLPPDIAVRAGRPWAFLDEQDLYADEAWSIGDGRGTTESGYRVLRMANPAPLSATPTLAPPTVGPALRQRLAGDAGAAPVRVTLILRNVPAWDVPLRPASSTLAAADLVRAGEERAAALAERARLLADMLADPAAQVASLGGRVVARGRYGGWLDAELPPAAVARLAERQDLLRIELAEGSPESHSLPLDGVRAGSHTNGQQLIDAGYTGEQSNPARHGYGDITIGVVEVGLFEDEACFFNDGAGCSGTSRVRERFRCDDDDDDGNVCEPIANFADNDENGAGHATVVASIIAGDYRQGQGDDYALGDGSWTAATGHSAAWESRYTGMAPEASLVLFGQMGGGAPAFADAFDDAIDRSLDITNNSWGWDGSGAQRCELEAVGPHEIELENAFDDGILMVVSAGNNNDPADPTASCNMNSPADLPKALAVNSVDASDAACVADYDDCRLDENYSSTGGMAAEIDGAVYQNAVSGVGLVAPDHIGGTGASGAHGTVASNYVGTSVAGPVVAGAAALVKDWYLDAGQSWINLPGRLQTVLLAMADRHSAAWKGGASSQRTFGSDRLWGLGKLRLRLLQNGAGAGPWGNHFRTTSFTQSGTTSVYVPFASPIPAGATLVKCVLLQVEDMSGKDDISKVDLEMRLRQPINGSCASVGATTATRIDATRDVKKMGAIEDQQATIGNRCLQITLDAEQVTSSGVTAQTMCYYAGIDDDQ